MLGADHPDKMTSLNSMAQIMSREGCFDEAQPLYEKSLYTIERVHGVNHPDTKVAAFNLEHNLKAQVELLVKENLFAKAKPLAEKAYRVASRVLGAENPDTLGLMFGLCTI